MPYYESVFIARQDVSAPQVEALADGFVKVIEAHGGQVTRREHWGLRSLAYRIKKNRKGYYVLFSIDAPVEAVHELERQMRINEDVLRCLTVRVEALEEGPSVVMQARSGRGEERGRREGRYRGGDAGERRPPSPEKRPAAERAESKQEGKAEAMAGESKGGEQ